MEQFIIIFSVRATTTTKQQREKKKKNGIACMRAYDAGDLHQIAISVSVALFLFMFIYSWLFNFKLLFECVPNNER